MRILYVNALFIVLFGVLNMSCKNTGNQQSTNTNTNTMKLSAIRLNSSNPSIENATVTAIELLLTKENVNRIMTFLDASQVNSTASISDFLEAHVKKDVELLQKVATNAPEDKREEGEAILDITFSFDDFEDLTLQDINRNYKLTHFKPEFLDYILEQGNEIEPSVHTPEFKSGPDDVAMQGVPAETMVAANDKGSLGITGLATGFINSGSLNGSLQNDNGTSVYNYSLYSTSTDENAATRKEFKQVIINFLDKTKVNNSIDLRAYLKLYTGNNIQEINKIHQEKEIDAVGNATQNGPILLFVATDGDAKYKIPLKDVNLSGSGVIETYAFLKQHGFHFSNQVPDEFFQKHYIDTP